ncbi:MAG: exodeoxyribonuclease VII large subunit [Thermodesulfovibrionales bacterium]
MNSPARTLSELLSEVRLTIKANFTELYWVVAEISEIRENQKGHCYLTLVEKQDNNIVAQSRANMWVYDYRKLMQKFSEATGEILKVGMKVMMLCGIDFHEVYGFGLIIKDIDPAYTLGEMALKKKQTIERLKREGLLDLNKSLPLPVVPQRIAVISSSTAAGYGDFINHLTDNPYGYVFNTRLFPALMQGEEAKDSIIVAFQDIQKQIYDFDVVVLIRGGGSSIDLSCFDEYDLAVAIARYQLPVITGIGHERDKSVADMVAHTSVKTPTAVAEFILSGVRSFEELLIEIHQRIKTVSSKILKNSTNELDTLMHRFIYGAKDYSKRGLNNLHIIVHTLIRSTKTLLQRHNTLLDNLQDTVRLLSPETILKRGYSITTFNGQILKDHALLRDGDVIETTLYKGRLSSIVKTSKKGVKRINEKSQRPYLFEGIE